MADLYPVNTGNGTTIAACNQQNNAELLANKVNRVAGETVVEVGEPIPFNPKHSDELIAALVAAATG
jgi:hypothetical protein